MNKKIFITPEYITAKEIKNIRAKLGLTQKEFAMLINCSKITVERWETKEGNITGPICLLLKILDKYPEYATSIRVPEKNMPIRLWYMHNQNVCTIIDVNEMNREVKITNYTDNVMFRAFMIIEKTEGRMTEDDFWIRIER